MRLESGENYEEMKKKSEESLEKNIGLINLFIFFLPNTQISVCQKMEEVSLRILFQIINRFDSGKI